MTNYKLLSQQAKEIIEGAPNTIAALSNLSALIFMSLEDINWAGFYELCGDKLYLAPFQGKPACMILNPGKGVCQAAITQNKTLNVPNVHEFDGHIACDSQSASEIVIPIRGKTGTPKYVLDIDSPHPSRFTNTDEQGLEAVAKTIEQALLSR